MATRTSRRAKAPEIPYPDLPEGLAAADPLFWRAAWLRNEAQAVAVNRHMDRIWDQRATTKPLRHALSGLWSSLQHEASKAFAHLIQSGGLLYAWLPEGGVA